MVLSLEKIIFHFLECSPVTQGSRVEYGQQKTYKEGILAENSILRHVGENIKNAKTAGKLAPEAKPSQRKLWHVYQISILYNWGIKDDFTSRMKIVCPSRQA